MINGFVHYMFFHAIGSLPLDVILAKVIDVAVPEVPLAMSPSVIHYSSVCTALKYISKRKSIVSFFISGAPLILNRMQAFPSLFHEGSLALYQTIFMYRILKKERKKKE